MTTASRPQRTIAREAGVRGISFLGGRDVQVRFRPADAGSGIVFVRSDLPDAPSVPAHVRYTLPRQRRTTIERGPAIVEMVEHVMAAMAGLRVDNCTVEIDGPETPGCDGSSRAFTEALHEAGIVEQGATREVLVIDRPITVREGDAILTAHPGDPGRLVLSYNLDYGPTPIGRQSFFVDVTPESFRSDLSASRTFLLEAEADSLRNAGIGSRTTERDLLIFGPDGVIGNELRYRDECARHKVLDLLGDLALTGVDLAGHVVAHRSGHQLNAAMARKLLEGHGRDDQGPGLEVDVGSMDIGAILKALPHRYPFLLIDRVVSMEPGRRVVALKNVTINEPFFQGHWPVRPIMPGVLIVEAMAQAAGVLMARQAPPGREAFLASIDGLKFRRPVVPGDQLRIEIDGVRSNGRATQVRAVAKVGDRVAAEGKIRFVLVESA